MIFKLATILSLAIHTMGKQTLMFYNVFFPCGFHYKPWKSYFWILRQVLFKKCFSEYCSVLHKSHRLKCMVVTLMWITSNEENNMNLA